MIPKIDTKTRSRIHIYEDYDLVKSIISQQLPVACIEMETKSFAILIHDKLIELLITKYHGEIHTHHYFMFHLTQNLNPYINIVHFNSLRTINRSCILLPILRDHGKNKVNDDLVGVYTAIADNYTEIDKNCHFVTSTFPKPKPKKRSNKKGSITYSLIFKL